MTSSRVGRLLRRRFTDVWRRSRRRHRPPRPSAAACNADGSPTECSTFLRRAQSAAASTDCRSRQPPSSNPRAPTGVVSTSSWTATLPTDTVDGTGPSTTVTRAGNTATSTTSLREQFTSFFQVSDNKLALKLFGNKNALEKEKQRHKAVGHWVIHPCSDFRSSVYC